MKLSNLEIFVDTLYKHEKEHPNELMPPEISAQFALQCLKEVFLGRNYYVSLPCNSRQVNTVILDAILRKYSKQYRAIIKKKQKELDKHEQLQA